MPAHHCLPITQPQTHDKRTSTFTAVFADTQAVKTNKQVQPHLHAPDFFKQSRQVHHHAIADDAGGGWVQNA